MGRIAALHDLRPSSWDVAGHRWRFWIENGVGWQPFPVSEPEHQVRFWMLSCHLSRRRDDPLLTFAEDYFSTRPVFVLPRLFVHHSDW